MLEDAGAREAECDDGDNELSLSEPESSDGLLFD